ncbi:hypothetical protein ABZ646_46440 [Streptomyces sp. NPDC007162]|uniref:hypothetical protein n=1 Tax=Streptomyces sp. NPDC007162 TaxID=3156917 RepID=UPI0033E00004
MREAVLDRGARRGQCRVGQLPAGGADAPLPVVWSSEPAARAGGVAATAPVQTVTVQGQTSKFLALAACTDPIGAVVGWTDLTAPGIASEPARLRALLSGEFLAGIRRQVRTEVDTTG